MSQDFLVAVARALGLNSKALMQVEASLGARSETTVVVTPDGEHLLAKQFIDGDAELRFEAELTALHGLVGPLVPRLLGADRESLVVVMEWLAGPTVEEVIRGTDRHDAERRLVAYARAIGLLHAKGRHALAEITTARQERGFAPRDFWPPFARDPHGAALKLSTFSASPLAELADEMVEVVDRTYGAPLDDATVVQWDNWPGNAVALPDRIVLVDLENAMYGSPLLDVSSWHLAFPAAPLRLPMASRVSIDLVG
jgi:hypothetical protein